MKFFHWHKWNAIAITHMTVSRKGYFDGIDWIAIPDPPKRHCTEILFRCECSAVKTEMVDGLWALEEITGEKKDSELEQLRKMAGVKE